LRHSVDQEYLAVVGFEFGSLSGIHDIFHRQRVQAISLAQATQIIRTGFALNVYPGGVGAFAKGQHIVDGAADLFVHLAGVVIHDPDAGDCSSHVT
jgi:hypothetical protein